MIVEKKCSGIGTGGGGCHDGTTSTKYGGGLDMTFGNSARAYKNLVGTLTNGKLVPQLPKPNPAGLTGALAYKCTGKGTRVVPGNASMSIMYSKVHDAMPICGAPEVQPGVPGGPPGPTATTPLTADEQNMIQTWINAGAMNN
jgi:hypothetical protein